MYERISVDELDTRLRDLFPDLIDWRPTDKAFLLVEQAEMDMLVAEFADDETPVIAGAWACEEVAWGFMVDVRRSMARNIEAIPVLERKINLAIGVADGTLFQGIAKGHTVNFFVSREHIYLLDMQTRKYWIAQKGQDKIHFAEI